MAFLLRRFRDCVAPFAALINGGIPAGFRWGLGSERDPLLRCRVIQWVVHAIGGAVRCAHCRRNRYAIPLGVDVRTGITAPS